MTGGRLYVTERGDGPPVVLMHGLMATGKMLGWLVEQLAARYRLILPDLAGRRDTVPGRYTAPSDPAARRTPPNPGCAGA